MPFLLALLGALIGIGFWWHRAKEAGQAAHEVADAVGRFRGKMRRNAIRRKAEASPVTAIDNPLAALQTLADLESAREAEIFANWAVAQMRGDTLAVIAGASEVLNDCLNENEKHQLVFLLDKATGNAGKPENYPYMLGKLAAALDIEVVRQTTQSF